MKLFTINGPVNEPEITGPEKTFTYVSDTHFAVLEGAVPDNPHLEEIEWEDDRSARDEVLRVLRATRRVSGMSPPERQVYDTLRAPTAAEAQTQFIENVKAKAGALIVAAADSVTRENMSVAFSLGLMTEAQEAAYRAGVQWAFAVQHRSREIIMTGEQDYADDAQWPEAPAEAIALAKEF